MSKEVDDLAVAVRANSDVEDSAILFIQGLAPLIADAAGDKAKSIALADEVRAKAGLLAAAITTTPPG
jgi:hypothetical protein